MTYLKRRRNALRDYEASLGCALRVVLGHQIVGEPDAIGLFRRAFRQRSASVPRQGSQADTMIELSFPIANGHRREEFGFGPPGDCHRVGGNRVV